MEITICKTAGLCAGAQRAYDGVIESLNKNPKTAVFKKILHNELLIEDLTNKGAKFCERLEDIGADDFVVLRAHGEEKQVYDYLKSKGINYKDSICVNVKRIHDLAIQKQNEGYNIIVVGTKKNGVLHDEIRGLISFLNSPIVVSNLKDVDDIEFDKDKKYFALCQSTFVSDLFEQIAKKIQDKAQAENILVESQNTICGFTAYNKAESKKLAQESDIAIVVGSKNSSNTVEIYETAKAECFTIFSNDFEEIKKLVLEYTKQHNIAIDNLKICILAGASTLKENLQKLELQLKFSLI